MNQVIHEAPMGEALAIRRELRERLRKLAGDTARSDDELANEALEHYLDHHDWFSREVQAGLEEADRGALIEDADVAAWVRSLDTTEEQPVPQPRGA